MLMIGGGLLAALAYLLGSIPFGLVLTRLFTSIDIRRTGSGNIGATNVRRMAGNRLGFLTLLGDVLKGALPVLLAIVLLWGEQPRESARAVAACAAVAAFTGHLYPLYLGFRTGGKGVATALGGCLVLSPPAVLVALAVFIAAVKISRRASVGSLAAAAALAPAVWLTTGSPAYLAGTLFMAVFIFARHRDNLKRLMAGTEPTIDKKPEPDRADT